MKIALGTLALVADSRPGRPAWRAQFQLAELGVSGTEDLMCFDLDLNSVLAKHLRLEAEPLTITLQLAKLDAALSAPSRDP